MVDFSRAWLPYIYLYLVGGGIFSIGIYIIIKSNSLNRDRVHHRLWLHILLFGIFYYMGIHSLFTFAALGKQYLTMGLGLVLIIMSAHLVFTILKTSTKKQ